MRKISIIIVIAGLIILGGYVFLRISLKKGTKTVSSIPVKEKQETPLDLRPLVISKLQQLIQKGSDSLYRFKADSIKLDILASKAELFNLLLEPDQKILNELKKTGKAPENVYNIHLSSFLITGINADDFLNKDHVDLKKIFLDHPVIDIITQSKKGNKEKNGASLYDKLSGLVKHLSIGTLDISHAQVAIHQEGKHTVNRFGDVNIHLGDFLLDEKTKNDKSRFLFSKMAGITLNNYLFHTPDSIYSFAIAHASIDAISRKMKVSGLTYMPRGGRKGFESKQKYRTEMYTLQLPEIRINDIDWWSLAQSSRLYGQSLQLSGGKFSVYFDRTKPSSGKFNLHNFPEQLFMTLPFQVYIKKINITGMDISYEEYNHKMKRSGKVFFTNVGADLSNVTNMKQQIEKNGHSLVNAYGKFLDKIGMKVKFDFSLAKAAEGQFTVDGKMDKMDGLILNPITEPLGYFQIKRGTMELGAAHIEGDNGSAHGKVMLLYNNLHVTPLKVDLSQPGNIKKKPATSLLANVFFIKDDNPVHGVTRSPDCSYTRDPEGGSFFNLVWKATLVGILKTLGIPEKYAKSM